MTPSVSVIIPVYNTAPYIKTCFLSVINQTHSNVEVIIINDASLDCSDDIIRELIAEANDRDVNYIKLMQNTGVGNVRNIGLERLTTITLSI